MVEAHGPDDRFRMDFESIANIKRVPVESVQTGRVE